MTHDPLISMWGFWLLSLGILFGYLFRYWIGRKRRRSAEARAAQLVAEAHTEAEQRKKETDLELKTWRLQAREAQEKEAQAKLSELQQLEKRLIVREEGMEKRFDALERREEEQKRYERHLAEEKEKLQQRTSEFDNLALQVRKTLERASGLTAEEARQELILSLTDEARLEAAKQLRMIDEETKQEAEKRAQHVISICIERIASDHVAERSVSTVTLPNEEMKGRIIGREGRNIRAFEAATGVELVIDDSPDAVTLSCFNPIRREIARRVLEELLRDGRIHPARIEEMVKKVGKEVDASVKEAGKEAVMELGLHRLHPELVRHMGMLRYRYSYAQNVLHHSIDVGFLCGMMAAELGMNQKKARRAGFLHDIGKAMTPEVEGSHAIIGMDLCRKHGERDDICHAIGAHHEDIPQETALDALVDAADALSGARPGARREVLETYMKRLEELERLTMEFKGVQKAYAIQAGREIRVMVQPDDVSDAQATLLSKDIARKIEHELTYPGQIKVMVIRETRAIEMAR
ncbi:MAG: ribonuclease Y [Deltaproteobacteria bacterium]|nr:ribonuclease Y [Deltaproteobacteria bacterium]